MSPQTLAAARRYALAAIRNDYGIKDGAHYPRDFYLPADRPNMLALYVERAR